jgi:hypothetical protein
MESARTSDLLRSAAISLWTVQGLVVCVLLSRRLSGEFTGAIPWALAAGWCLLCGVLSAAALWCYRTGYEAPSHNRKRPLPATAGSEPWSSLRRWTPEALSGGLAVFSILAAIPQPTAPVVGVVTGGIVIAVITGYGIAVSLPIFESAPPRVQDANRPLPAAVPHPVPEASHLFVTPAAALSRQDDDSTERCDADEALQTMTRRSEEGLEVVEGVIRVEFADLQREASVHLAFCPPLPGRPNVDLEDLDAHGWDLKIAAAYPFGLRLTIRRRPTGPTTGRIAYFASAAVRRAA